MRAYISGAITGLPASHVVINFREASKEAQRLGDKPVNPADILGDKKWQWWQFMVVDILPLVPCRAIYLQRNWKSSKGAKIERKFAKLMFKKIIYQN